MHRKYKMAWKNQSENQDVISYKGTPILEEKIVSVENEGQFSAKSQRYPADKIMQEADVGDRGGNASALLRCECATQRGSGEELRRILLYSAQTLQPLNLKYREELCSPTQLSKARQETGKQRTREENHSKMVG